MTQTHTKRPVWVLKCDACGHETSPSFDRPNLVLAEASGWQCSPGCPVLDLCPKCRMKYPAELYPGCPCYTCDSPTWPVFNGMLVRVRMSLCPTCGDKRCPGAQDHTQHHKED